MKNIFIAAASIIVVTATPTYAVDCGEPPIDAPIVPAGETISADQVRKARDDVLAYSGEVDKFISCMDQRVAAVAPYMTKEQLTRRQEDMDDLHNQRRDLQIKLNEAIRSFRRQTSNS